MPIKYPTEFKVKAIRRYEKGESIKELCKELNISQSTLYHWRKQYCSIRVIFFMRVSVPNMLLIHKVKRAY